MQSTHSQVYSAQFSPDGQRVLTTLSDNTARLWDAPTVSSKDAPKEMDVLLLADLAEAAGGVTIQASGQAEILSLMPADRVRGIREKIAARFQAPSSKLTPVQQFLQWSVSERRTRTISPFSELTVAKWMESRINEGTLDGLRAAIQVDPANARLAAHFGRVLADYAHDALAKGTDADEARRAREEADFQTRRALKLAPDNDEVEKLRSEVVKLLHESPPPVRAPVPGSDFGSD
jgi:hypothetical protein